MEMGSIILENSFHGRRSSIRKVLGFERGSEFLNDPSGAFSADHQSDVKRGCLQNGLSYYVHRNSKPNKRAALALVVKVGSILEGVGEQGVAHMIEHLAFSATKNYENHEIVRIIESIGGECNARTSFDETVYELQVPIDKPELLSQAISILAEFTEIRIADEDLEKERGVVMEEYRSKRNATQRTQEAYWRLLMQGSKYANRLPIGDERAIRDVTSRTVKQFYQKWYHPSRMGVMAVGDFPDTKNVVKLIETHFGHKTSAPNPSSVPNDIGPLPFHKEPRYLCYGDPEATGSEVVISYKMPVNETNSLVESMFLTALNRRFLKLSSKNDAPYFSCSLNPEDIAPSVRAYKMNSICKEKEILKALESMLIEVARVRLHRFSEWEISNARDQMLSKFKVAHSGSYQRESTSLRNDYVQQFIGNEPVIPDFGVQSLPRGISASDMSRFAEKLKTSCSCVILTVEPQAHVIAFNLKNVVQKVSKLEEHRSISPWDIIEQIPKEIVDKKPNPGNIVDQREISNIGAIEVNLSNGMKVCYKCTDFLKDQILFSGFSKGGLSELSESEYLSSKMGASFAQEIGEFGHKPSVLADMLAAKKVRVNTEVGNYIRTFYGDCSPSNLETAMQLVYQLFMKNITPGEEVNLVMKKTEEQISAKKRDPLTSFRNQETELHFQNSYFLRPLERSDLNNIDSSKACEYFNNCFKDPSTFTVAIVGDFNPVSALRLILQYLGGIPKPSEPIRHLKCDYINRLPFNFPTTEVIKVVSSQMREEQCQVALSFPVELMKGTKGEEKWYLHFMQELFKMKILQVLRFKRGQIYSTEVSHYLNNDKPCGTDPLRGYIRIAFSCDPKMSSKLVGFALDEILHLQDEGPSDQEFSTILENGQRSYENGLQDNNNWLIKILDIYYSGINCEDVGTLFKVHERLSKSCTQLKIKSAMQRILPCPCKKQYTAVILMPQPPWLQ